MGPGTGRVRTVILRAEEPGADGAQLPAGGHFCAPVWKVIPEKRGVLTG